MSDLDERLDAAADDRERDPEKDQVEVLESQERDEDQAQLEDEEHEPAVAAAHFTEVVERADASLRGKATDHSDAVGLSAHERLALDLLVQAASGVDLSDEHELLAEDRMALLNYALALLQPILAMGLMPELAEMRADYDRLVDDVTELRERLEQLDGAQEEKEAAEEEQEGEADDDEPDDKPDDKHKPKSQWAKRNKAGRKPVGLPVPTGEPEGDTLFGKPGEPAVEKPTVPTTLLGKPGEPAVDKPVVAPTVFGKPNEPAVERPVVAPTVFGKPGDKPVEKPSLPSTVWDGPDASEKR